MPAEPLVPRSDFPVLAREVRGKRLVYLDNAATTQKPFAVLAAVADYYRQHNANVHRALHTLASEATEMYEAARRRVARFIGADDPRGVVFVRNTTEAINLVAASWARARLRAGDVVLLTVAEHHSNIVPWQLAARATGARLRYLPLGDDGRLDLAKLDEALAGVRIVALAHASNVLGTVHPVGEIARAAHEAGALVLVDAAQSAPHMPVDVRELGCDFLAFSGHKMLAPMGIGVLWARPALLEEMEPYMGGGEMIDVVELESSTWREIPWKFEAGTPNVAGAVGLAAAIDYLEAVGRERIHAHEAALGRYARELLAEIPGVVTYGPEDGDRAGIVSFTVAGLHPHDVSQVLDDEGVAVRAGHHCCQPLMRRLGVEATARASFYLYNDREDALALARAVRRAKEFFRVP
ncbi:MAG: cysteine desulfurase [Clostridia bacterium]|nr:cysteine desulfurase [Clostridia bacterium]